MYTFSFTTNALTGADLITTDAYYFDGNIYSNQTPNAEVVLYNSEGKQLLNSQLQNGKLDVSAMVSPGVYILRVADARGISEPKKIFVAE